MSNVSNDNNDERRPTASRVEGLMAWIRGLLPIVLAGIGWYVGHTVGVFEERLGRLEAQVVTTRLTTAENISSANEKFTYLAAQILVLQDTDRRNQSKWTPKEDYLRDKASIEADIKALEKATK